ncbi:Stemmadenine O-acetyltransferase [Linum perenne]
MLNLSYNPFQSGRIPPELGNLTNLEVLWLTEFGAPQKLVDRRVSGQNEELDEEFSFLKAPLQPQLFRPAREGKLLWNCHLLPTDGQYERKWNSEREKLKSSPSKTLDTLYPLFGRIKDNITVEDFQSGVPVTETRIKRCNSVSEFLKCPNMKFLNHLSPVETFTLITKYDEPQPPPLVVQINVFPCGRITLGFSFNHKVMIIINTWASLTSTGHDNHLAPKLSIEAASSVFPPRQSIPPEMAYCVDALYH